MNTFQFNLRFLSSRDLKPLFLLLVSVTGLLFGIILSYNNVHVISGIDGALLFSKPSLLCLLTVNLIPLLLLYFLLAFPINFLCYPFVFLCGVCSGFCGITLYYLFGDGAWLIRFFLFFSHDIASVICWLFMFYNARRVRIDILRNTCISAFAISAVTVIDIFVIAPVISDFYII